MNRHFFYTALLMACVGLFSSCATIVSGTTSKIYIDGEVDEPVTIVTSKDEYKDVTLPTTVEVKRRHLDGQHIQITSENHEFQDIVLQKTINPWAFGNLIIYGLPLGVDLASNAVSTPKYQYFYIQSSGDSLSINPVRSLGGKFPSYRNKTYWSDLKQRKEIRQKAQQTDRFRRHEVSMGLGFGDNQADHDMHNLVHPYEKRYNFIRETECGNVYGDSYATANIEYHYRLNHKWDVGALVAWGASKENYIAENFYDVMKPVSQEAEEKTYYGGERCRTFVAAPSVRYTWTEAPNIRFYSRVALGVLRHRLRFDCWDYTVTYEQREQSIVSAYHLLGNIGEAKTKWRPAYQLTAIGGSIGSRWLHFYGELGYGCLGIVRVGISFRF